MYTSIETHTRSLSSGGIKCGAEKLLHTFRVAAIPYTLLRSGSFAGADGIFFGPFSKQYY